MYNLKKVSITTIQQLEEHVSDEEIYRYYLQHDFIPGVKYRSPLPGRNDKDPSFVIDYDNKGRLKWRDYGVQIPKDGYYVDNALGFAQRMLNSVTYRKAMQQIYDDIVLGNRGLNSTEIQKIRLSALNKIESAGVRIRTEMTPKEFFYWERYGATRQLLRKYELYAAESVYFNNRLWRKSIDGDPLYAYIFNRDKDQEAWQAYRPLAPFEGNKFRTHNTKDVIIGADQLPDRSYSLIITKSMKDVIVLSGLGYTAIAPMSESRFLDLIPYADELNSRFDSIYILFDNDATGIKCAEYLRQQMPHWRPFQIPERFGKDPAETMDAVGEKGLRKILDDNLKL